MGEEAQVQAQVQHVYCKHEEDIQGLKSDVKNLLGWQRTQNGSINRIEEKVDHLTEYFQDKLHKIFLVVLVACLGLIGNLIFLVSKVLVSKGGG